MLIKFLAIIMILWILWLFIASYWNLKIDRISTGQYVLWYDYNGKRRRFFL